jgi:hypothetical protein
MVVSKGGCSEYLSTAEFIEEVDNLFDSFHGGTRVDLGKTLCCILRAEVFTKLPTCHKTLKEPNHVIMP